MKRIKNSDYATIEQTSEELDLHVAQLDSLIEKINDGIIYILESTKDENGHNLESLIGEISNKKSQLFDALNEAASDAEAYYDERSERWRESDAGTDYEAWKSELVDAACSVDDEHEVFEIHIHSDEIENGVLTLEATPIERNELPNQSPTEFG
ncbi:hypothetical protein HJ136_21520 [Vibrio parahaemolyticus]|nr:hypothetical protein [Vibrio parahaemolyticus]